MSGASNCNWHNSSLWVCVFINEYSYVLISRMLYLTTLSSLPDIGEGIGVVRGKGLPRHATTSASSVIV